LIQKHVQAYGLLVGGFNPFEKLVVSPTHLKIMSQNGAFPQAEMKINNI